MAKQKKTKSKRANGEGTFYQQEDGTWVHQITLGRKPDGNLDRKSFSGKTRAACIERREAYIEEKKRREEQNEQTEQEKNDIEARKRGHSLESEALFDDAFLNWLHLFKAPPSIKPSTYASYLDIYNVHFVEYFSDKMLYEINKDIIQEYYQSKQKIGARKDKKGGGLSAKTIRNHHMLLKAFFSYAQEKYKLPSNPTDNTQRPEVVTPEMRVLGSDEMAVFIEEVCKESQRVAILFGLFTGVRVGELLSLEVSDVDLKNQTIAIRRNIIRVKTEAVELDNPNIRIINYNPQKKTHLIVQNTPKTKNSYRVIPISDDLCEMILGHLYFLEQSLWPNTKNLLFPSSAGTHIDPKSFELRLKAVSDRCAIRKVNPHALRHTFATRLVENNIPLNVIKDILGHASITTTQKYMHSDTEEKRDAIGNMVNYINISALRSTNRLNGAKKRMKFEDVMLPDWSEKDSQQANA